LHALAIMNRVALIVGVGVALGAANGPGTDPLPSWNDGRVKRAILGFVARVTAPGPDHVPPAERIAVFDNDGTLWPEQPMYVQKAFALDPMRAASVGATTKEFEDAVAHWIATARHPQTGRLYTDMVYAPMRELMAYLRANGFSIYIVTGGGAEFVRPWVERVYGIPRDHVIGSWVKLAYERRDGRGVLVRQPAVDFITDGPGKPIAIEHVIGRRPILAFGNSDGDYEMLEYTTTAGGPRLGLILHHTDAAREWAYDRASHTGRLARALDNAPAHGWIVVDMRRDWRVVFQAEPSWQARPRSVSLSAPS
jgi:phosphoserine phosphatase